MAQKHNPENPEAIKPNVKVSEERVNEKEFEKHVFAAQKEPTRNETSLVVNGTANNTQNSVQVKATAVKVEAA